MDTTHTTPQATTYDFTRLAWVGYVLGIASMAALFVYGLAIGEAGLLVVSSSTAAMVGAAWASSTVARGRQARK